MKRTTTLILAALLIVLGAGSMFVISSGGMAAASGDSVSVYRVTGDIAPGTAGTALNEQTVEQVSVPASAVPPLPVTGLAEIATKKAVTTIYRGQVLIGAQWADEAATGGLPIPPGMNAIAVQMGDPERVAGFVQPGSLVAVYATVGDRTSLLLSNAQVIAIGPSAAGATGAGASTGNAKVAATIVTLALNAADSEKLVNAKQTGSLYMGLLPKS
jgi:pilus assembly protein CpaB